MHALAAPLVALLVFAQTHTAVPVDPGEPPPPPDGGMGPLFMIVAVIAFMYFLVLRPQQQREKDEKSLLEKLKKNDHVVTRGGIIGVVMQVGTDEVVLKVDENQNVKIRFRKDAIAQVIAAQGDEKKDDEKDKKG